MSLVMRMLFSMSLMKKLRAGQTVFKYLMPRLSLCLEIKMKLWRQMISDVFVNDHKYLLIFTIFRTFLYLDELYVEITLPSSEMAGIVSAFDVL
jgi:hypothetical protein